MSAEVWYNSCYGLPGLSYVKHSAALSESETGSRTLTKNSKQLKSLIPKNR